MGKSLHFYACEMGAAVCLLAGCGIGGFWMNGNPFSSPDIPYIEKWEKPGMTPETRGQDSAICGGGSSTRAPLFNDNQMKAAHLPGEREYLTYSRLHNQWQSCMLNKGYRFKGKCYDNEISRQSPACSAP